MKPSYVYNIHPSQSNMIRLFAVGDTRISVEGSNNSDSLLSESLLRLIRDNDISVVNLECPLTDKLTPVSKCGPNLASPTGFTALLQGCGFGIAGLANNHIMDHGVDAMLRTVDLLRTSAIEPIGVGLGIEQACSPRYVDIKGSRIAFLAFADDQSFCLARDCAGTAPLDPIWSFRAIQQAKQSADVVVVLAHGGNEYSIVPSPRIRRLYRGFVDSGAGAVIGHHPHVIQGVEIYKDTPIVYSLGNFLFEMDAPQKRCWYEGLLVRLGICCNRVASVEAYGSKQRAPDPDRRGTKVSLLDQRGSVELAENLLLLSDMFKDSDLLTRYWQCFCVSRRDYEYAALRANSASMRTGLWRKLGSAAKHLRPIQLVFQLAECIDDLSTHNSVKQERFKRLQHILGCPAKLEVLLTLIEMEMADADLSVDPHLLTKYSSLLKRFGL